MFYHLNFKLYTFKIKIYFIFLFDGHQSNHFLRHVLMMEFITKAIPINNISGNLTGMQEGGLHKWSDQTLP